MEYQIQYSDAALSHLSGLTKRQQVVVVSAVRQQLVREPDVSTRKKKRLRPNLLAPWELRIGDIRVYYDVNVPLLAVEIHAIGLKKHNVVFIAGEVFHIMKTIDMSKARRSLASYIRSLEGDPVVVTKNGKTIAALVPLTGMDWESFAVSTNPTFIKIIEEARKSFKLHGGLSTEEVCQQLGIKLPKRHRNGVSRSVPTRKAG